jgi:hypothetical protein
MCDLSYDIFNASVMLRLDRAEANEIVLQFNRAASTLVHLTLYRAAEIVLLRR